MPDEVEIPAPDSSPGPPVEGLPLFDAHYRWVLLFALRWLRDEAAVDLDLDDEEQLGIAYDLLSRTVQAHVHERGLATKLDASRVSAIAESRSVRATVLEVLLRERPHAPGAADDDDAGWRALVAGPAVRRMITRGARAADPSLEPAELDRRALDRRMEFVRSFGLHARITEVDLSPGGGLRVHVAFDEDLAFAPEDLKALEINGIPLSGAQLVDVRRNESGSPRVQAVIAVNVDKGSIASLKSLPMSVTATTRGDVRMQALKMV